MKSFKFSKATRKNGKINILNKDNKSYSIAKYNIESLKNSIYLYYCFFIIQYVLALGMTNGYSGGVEGCTVAFLFIVGIVVIRKIFYFATANGVSRKFCFKGMIISILFICAMMAIIDVAINRVFNVFAVSPTNYDMTYGNFRNLSIFTDKALWTQANDIVTLINTVLFQFIQYSTYMTLGMIIGTIYFKCERTTKVLILIITLVLSRWAGIAFYHNSWVKNGVETFIDFICGYNPLRPILGLVTSAVGFVIIAVILKALLKKATVR